MSYEIIVVGGGHAGCEAALASARKKHKTLLITSNINNISNMPCNPSLGGPAKGIVVREIDALGGEMGRNADKAILQMKMLNMAKGPAVRALRAQIDKVVYPKIMLETLKKEKKLHILEGMVEDLIIDENVVKGIILEDGTKIKSNIVILTTGTYMKANILIGSTKKRSGPNEERASLNLSDNLRKIGFEIQRLKTGTPPRIEKSSIDFSKMREEKGDSILYTFSHDMKPIYKIKEQKPCYLIHTTKNTHELIKNNLEKSSMYGGYVEGIGPRYCPSIEDKITRFSDKESHQLFLEPESIYYDDIYLQGFSTSMPIEMQEEMIHTLPGLEKAKIKKYAYAIEYDAINPIQIKSNLETKLINNLYTAGQINGTSGYEEAAAQGLMAGINASLSIEGREPLVLKRSEAYIGVLIDDLVTKGTKEPYRLLTSRAEFRLLLRNDNADLRLREYGYNIGLINKHKYNRLIRKKKEIDNYINYFRTDKINPTKENNEFLRENNSAEIKDGISIYNLLKRPEITINHIKKIRKITLSKEILEQIEINIKYEGYISKVYKEVGQLIKYEKLIIPSNINYDNVHNLASEAKQKLKEINPTSLGQAMRISGVNPSDIAILMIYFKKEEAK